MGGAATGAGSGGGFVGSRDGFGSRSRGTIGATNNSTSSISATQGQPLQE
jgi:hypothetical protein